MVGHLGTPQLGGLAVATSVLLTVFSLSIFLAYGTTSAVARLLGAGDEQEAAHQAVQSLWFAVAAGVVLAAVLGVTSQSIVAALGAEGEVATNALVYLRIGLVGTPMVLVTMAGTGYLRGLQDTRTPLVVAIGTSLLNLLSELVLIVGLGFGIGASSLCTVLAQSVGGAVYVAAVVRGARKAGASLAPNLASQQNLLRVGVDLVVRTAALRFALLAITAVAVRIGDLEVAAQQIAFEIWSLLAFGFDALAIAAQAMVGCYLGAGRQDDARAVSRRLLVIGFGAGLGTTVVVAAAAPVAAGLFTNDAVVAALVMRLLWWVAGLQVIAAVAFVLDGVLIGAGDQRYLAKAMVVAALAFASVLAPVLPLGLGIEWVWVAFGVMMAVRALTLLGRFGGDRWLVPGAALPN